MNEYLSWLQDKFKKKQYALFYVGSIMFLLSLSPIVLGALSDGVVSYWDWSGNYNDTMKRNNGTMTGGSITTTRCKLDSDGCLDLGTTSNNFYVTTGTVSLPTGASNRTYNCWLNQTNNVSQQYAFAYGEQNPYKGFGDAPTTNFHQMWTHTGDYITNIKIMKNQWQMITVTYNGTHMAMFSNGTNKVINAVSLNTGTTLNRIGSSFTAASPYSGIIDDCAIWNRVLSDAEVLSLYTASKYPFNTSTPDTCTYTSGNWNILASDNCVISTNVSLGGNNVTCRGTGSLKFTTGNIFRYGLFAIQSGCNVTKKS